jgi:aspartate carbamoyltransferase catalytic subunit
MYTVRTALNRPISVDGGSFDGLRVAMVGDIKHSRVARSTTEAFKLLGANVTWVSPKTLLPPVHGESVVANLDEVIEDVDVLYLLRMQNERMSEALVPHLREYTARFGLTPERAARIGRHVLVMHPGPMNRGVEMAVDPSELPGSVINQQVTNGIIVRMAVLFELLGSGSGNSLTGNTES